MLRIVISSGPWTSGTVLGKSLKGRRAVGWRGVRDLFELSEVFLQGKAGSVASLFSLKLII